MRLWTRKETPEPVWPDFHSFVSRLSILKRHLLLSEWCHRPYLESNKNRELTSTRTRLVESLRLFTQAEREAVQLWTFIMTKMGNFLLPVWSFLTRKEAETLT